MRREEAISTLRSFLPALKRDFGVRRICLFGSTARDEALPNSDLDLLVDFEVGPTFDSFMGLKFFLEDHLGQRVDLVTLDALKPRLRPAVERQAVDVARHSQVSASHNLSRKPIDRQVVRRVCAIGSPTADFVAVQGRTITDIPDTSSRGTESNSRGMKIWGLVGRENGDEQEAK